MHAAWTLLDAIHSIIRLNVRFIPATEVSTLFPGPKIISRSTQEDVAKHMWESPSYQRMLEAMKQEMERNLAEKIANLPACLGS